jgi:hypothetical protein
MTKYARRDPASRETERFSVYVAAFILTGFWVSCGGQSTGPSPASGSGGQSAGSGAGAVGGVGAPGGTGAGTSGSGAASSGEAGRGVGGNGVGARGGASGGVIPLTGGSSGAGGRSGASGAGGRSGASGGVEQAGAAGDAGECDSVALWRAITRGAGATRCDLLEPPPEGDAVDRLHGAVVIDDEGWVVDNTGLTGADKQAWLSDLGGQRWLCLASTTLGYSCEPIRG